MSDNTQETKKQRPIFGGLGLIFVIVFIGIITTVVPTMNIEYKENDVRAHCKDGNLICFPSVTVSCKVTAFEYVFGIPKLYVDINRFEQRLLGTVFVEAIRMASCNIFIEEILQDDFKGEFENKTGDEFLSRIGRYPDGRLISHGLFDNLKIEIELPDKTVVQEIITRNAALNAINIKED